jgi:hypothetical protein
MSIVTALSGVPYHSSIGTSAIYVTSSCNFRMPANAERGLRAETHAGRQTKKGRCRLHGGASGSGGPPGERNGQYRHGERTKAAIAERQIQRLLKMLRAGLT